MRTIKAEIEQHMTGLQEAGRGLTARYRFPQEFIGFQGHFPGKGILPGVCQIQSVLSMCERWAGHGVMLREIMVAKYATPVFPGEEIVCHILELSDLTGEVIVRARIEKGPAKVSELKLRIAPAVMR